MAGATREALERRFAEISEEIRRYPSPIARCDEHLAALLEERARVLARLRRRDERRPGAAGCSATARWINDGGLHGA